MCYKTRRCLNTGTPYREQAMDWKSKNFAEIETWILAQLESKPVKASSILEALASSKSDATSLADLCLDAFFADGNRDAFIHLLMLKASWNGNTTAFRSECVKQLLHLMPPPNGRNYVTGCGMENSSVPVGEALRRLDVLVRLTPGTPCTDKTWGFGIVKRVDEFYRKIVVDFDGKADHTMTFEYASEVLEIVTKDHILARRFYDPAGLSSLASSDPAEIVRIAIRSMGPMDALQLKDLLNASGIVPEKSWKPFWDGARRGLKADPTVDLPPNRNAVIRIRATARAYDETWFSRYHAETDMEKILELAAAVLDAVGTGLSQAQQSVIDARLRFVAKGADIQQPVLSARALLLARRLTLPQDPSWNELGARLVQSDPLQRTLCGLPSKAVEPFIQTMASEHPGTFFDSLLLLVPGLPATLLGRVVDCLVASGHQEKLVALFRTSVASKNAGGELLYWLCRNPEKSRDWSIASPFNLAMAVVDYLSYPNDTDPVRVRNQMMSFMEDRKVLQPFLSLLTPVERAEIMSRVNGASTWDAASRRNTMAAMIKLYPELKAAVSATPPASAAKAPAPRITSWRSYRERQMQLKKLIDEGIPANSREIAVARSYGDLRENAEYKAAKEMQGVLMRRRDEWANDLTAVQATDFPAIPAGKSGPGTTVTLRHTDGRTTSCTILGEWDRDESLGIISNQSALAKSISGHTAGETVRIPNPDGGDESCTIVSIEPLSQAVRDWIGHREN